MDTLQEISHAPATFSKFDHQFDHQIPEILFLTINLTINSHSVRGTSCFARSA
jgi:hypothetical protein